MIQLILSPLARLLVTPCLFLVAAAALAQDTTGLDDLPPLLDKEPTRAEILATLEAGLMDEATWSELVIAHGGTALPFIVELRDVPGREAAATDGFLVLISTLPMDTLFRAIDTLPDEQRQELLTLIDLLPMEAGDLFFNMRLVKLLRASGEYLRAYEFGRRGWLRWPNQAFLAHTALAVAEGELQGRLWQLAGARLQALPDTDARAAELEFYAELAYRLGTPNVVPPLLTIARLQATNLMPLIGLTDRLARLGMRELVRELLAETREPALMYQRVRAGEDRQPTEAEWAAIDDAILTTQAALRLALLLDSLDEHETARPYWEQVRQDTTMDTRIQANARLKLAEYAQADGNFAEAADHFAAMVKLLEATPQGLPAPARERFDALIERLRTKAKDGPDAYSMLLHDARIAYRQKDFDAVLKHLAQAVEIEPRSFEAWSLYYETAKRVDRFAELPAIGDRLAAATVPEDAGQDLLLSGALHLADAEHFALAETLASRATTQRPEQPSAWFILASVRERMGDYAGARQALAAAGDEARDIPRYWRILGMIEAQAGNYARAADAFEAAIEHGYLDDYLRLWQALMEKRAGTDIDDELRDFMQARGSALDPWIRHVYAHLLGELSAEKLLAQAKAAESPGLADGRLAEAHFYIALNLLAAGRDEAARGHLQAVLKLGITPYIEHAWARAELKRLQAGS